jgi:FAD/FMN-containing dehydrogenase
LHRATPSERFEPASEEEVVALVRRAAASGTRLKAVGAGHSFSRIAVPDQAQVSLDRLGRVLSVDGQRVTVEAGIRLRDLCRALDQRGLALPILGSIAEQSLAGVTATGTHGSSLRHGNLGSLLHSMRLVTGTGEVVDLTGPELDAARTHLGALGVVTQVSFDAVPAFRLEEELATMPFEAALEAALRLARQEEFVKLWWLPHTDAAAVFTYRRTEKPVTASALGRWLDENFVNRFLFAGLLGLGGLFPGMVPALNGVVAGAYFRPHFVTGVSHRMLTVAMPPVHREAEWAIPVETTAEALRRLKAVIEAKALVVDFVLEVRFVRGDPGWMSPAHGGDVCQVGIYAAGRADPYFAAAAEVLRELGGRPHWGKEADLTAADVRRMWPKAADFQARMQASDPQGVFRNAFLDTLFPALKG